MKLSPARACTRVAWPSPTEDSELPPGTARDRAAAAHCGDPATATVGGAGGNGFGGGVYNDGQSILTVTGSTVTGNTATVGAGGSGGSAGLGQGGGIYLSAGVAACLDVFTQAHTKNNHASTSGDDIFGDFTTCP